MISIEMKQRRTFVFSLLLFTIVLSLVLAASPLEAQTTVWDPNSTLAFSQGGTATAATGVAFDFSATDFSNFVYNPPGGAA